MNVSIVIPAYNAAETLASTLYSVLAQSCENWEAIVVDDGSHDDTAKIAKEFGLRDARIRLVSRANGGEAAARNSGIEAARFDWLLFLDADDWILPCYLQRVTNELSLTPMLDAVHCGWARVAVDGTQVVEAYQPPDGDLFPILARRAALTVHSCVVRKSIVLKVGKFDPALQTCPDWDLWQRIARTGARFGSVREVLALYRMRPRSASLRARQIFTDGMTVLKRGHASDPRVKEPHPSHANGEPPDGVRTQEYYLLCWCAGVMLGHGEDSRPLLELLKDHAYPELHPPAVAECLFEACPLAQSKPPQAWEVLWPRLRRAVEDFLTALEAQSQAPQLAQLALASLREMIVKQSPALSAFTGELQRTVEMQSERIGSLELQVHGLVREKEQLAEKVSSLDHQLQEQSRQLTRCEREKDLAQHELSLTRQSPERRLGDLLLNRLRLRLPIRMAKWVCSWIRRNG